MIAFRDKALGNKANAILQSGLYSSPHMHHLIALAITILELKRVLEKNMPNKFIANSKHGRTGVH